VGNTVLYKKIMDVVRGRVVQEDEELAKEELMVQQETE
jgi:hypothetical protein